MMPMKMIREHGLSYEIDRVQGVDRRAGFRAGGAGIAMSVRCLESRWNFTMKRMDSGL